MALASGTRLGPYEIIGPLGKGGMGEVYSARDTRLDRIVAIKVSHARFSERFEREARAVAALNHPHICQLYDVGPDYLVMEHVNGVPIHPVNDMRQLLDWGLQIADGLVTAHAAGIVHRDLKPSNVLVTSTGQVKILDFGLALVAPGPIRDSDLTRPAVLTEAGTAVGTVAYMSPEQARGETVDARTDLWSLGVMLYELTTRVRPFDGATSAVTFEALLGRAPVPVRERNPKVSPDFERVIGRLLEKDRETRYQSAADVRADLKRIARESGEGHTSAAAAGTPAGAVRPQRTTFAVVAAGLIVVVLAALAWLVLRDDSGPITSPSEYVQLTSFADSVVDPSLSSDGRMVTFVRAGLDFPWRGDIYVKLLPDGESVRLTNSSHARYGPIFTPDGSRVAYTQVSPDNDGRSTWDTWTVPIGGGEPTRLLPNASGLAWLDSQHVLFSEIKGTGLHMGIVTATSGRSGQREIYFPEHERAMAHYSYLSPDRSSVLIVEMDRTSAFQPCRLTPFDGSSPGRQVGPTGACTAAAWSSDGRWMYFSVAVDGASHLWRQRMPSGQPEQITFGLTEEYGVALAADGRSIVTSVGQQRSAIWIHDSRGDRQVTTEGIASDPQLSVDGQRLYYLLQQPALGSPSTELRSLDLVSGKTDLPLPDQSVRQFVVSRDEREVAFTTTAADGVSEIWLAAIDRSTPPRRIVRGGSFVSFGPDSNLIFLSLEDKVNFLARVRKDGSERERITQAPMLNKGPGSPDGVWVTAFSPGVGERATPEAIAVSTRSGASKRICPASACQVRWSPDGQWLYFGERGGGPTRTAGLTVAVPVGPTGEPPDSLAAMLDEVTKGVTPRGARLIERGSLYPGPDPSTYAFVKQDVQRNLFRVPIH